MARKTATPPKRIFIIDDHPIFRDGLRRLVSREAGLEVCGEAEDAETCRGAAGWICCTP
jgi:DNA-binding NarL/FixJ family response regulator